jgi:hypothetical protein
MEEHNCTRSISGKDRNLGIFVKSWSGNSSESICTLRGQDDVKHIVTVTNLEVYSLHVECIGRIPSNPRKAKFSSTASNSVIDNRWSATAADIEKEGGNYRFDHVNLYRTDLSGSERVHTTIRCDWLDKQGDLPSLVFSVTT